jgi:hypothetical protein
MTRLINAYSKARKEIHSWLDEQNIPRNDNIVGRIGEYFAIEFIKNESFSDPVVPAVKSNQEGYDFLVGSNKYSVKTMTRENKTGSTTPIKLNPKWDYLVAIKLDDDFNLESLSIIDYQNLKDYLDTNSIKQGKEPGIKKIFRWWKILNQPPYKRV